ncbi:MAG: IS1595 family transposase [Acholeplasmataceae bacterium]|nr:IS1595 family transposase [Acholeplasmataceae bacterium]
MSPISTRPHQFYCKDCHSQYSVLKGTLFENSKVSLNKWFLAIFLASRDKRGVSALTLSRELDIARPHTLSMLRALRNLMASRDQNYKLTEIVEIDEFYIGASGGKQGRGTSKNKVIMALSYKTVAKNIETNEFVEDYEDSISDIPMYCKMTVVDVLDAKTINSFVVNNIESGSKIITDKYRGYNKLLETNNVHEKIEFDLNGNQYKNLHIVISNLKSFVLGTYHGLGNEYLQSYLDEFCYRFNRRKMHDSLFNRLLELTIENKQV